MLIALFWILIFFIFYAYAGYTLFLGLFSVFSKKPKINYINNEELPEVTLLIAAYNEKDIIEEKIENSNNLDYPKNKLHQLWITDGSDDGSEEILRKLNIKVLHLSDRKGKTAAINRAMAEVKTPYTVLCDANSMLSPLAIKKLIFSFTNKEIGCVAGEKRVISLKKDKAPAAGEGLYWNYESLIKKLESNFGSTLGAAGELYAIRTELYNPPSENIVLDDFVVSLSIAEKGYKIKYEPGAFAVENSSFNTREEIKRKIRIAAGGFQVLFGKLSLLNFFVHFKLSFQYLSHKVIRWIIVPFSLPLLLLLNILIVLKENPPEIYLWLLAFQLVFYFVVLIGLVLKDTVIKLKVLFFPFYVIMMNYCIIRGFFRYLGNKQEAAWEKVKRNN